MSAVYPSLTPAGWISENYKKADMALAHFFVSQYSQSNLYKGKVSSLPYLIQQFGNDPQSLARQVESNVLTLFNRYFGEEDGNVVVSVNVSIEFPTAGDESRYEVRLDAGIAINGVNSSLGKLINVKDSTLIKITELNNG